MSYHVSLSPAADKVVAKLPKGIRQRIALRLKLLEENPRPPGSIKLTNQEAYRVRAGDYRIIYTIHDDRLLVLVIEIGHRGDVYRRR